MNPRLKTSSSSPRVRVTALSLIVSSKPQVASQSGQVLKTVVSVSAAEDMRHLHFGLAGWLLGQDDESSRDKAIMEPRNRT
jgi:hypothetical protein